MWAPVLCRTIRGRGSESEPCGDSGRGHSRPREQDCTRPPTGHRRRSLRSRDGARGEGADLMGTLALTVRGREATGDFWTEDI